MFKLIENKSQIWFKILTPKGYSGKLDKDNLKWDLPKSTEKGAWMISPFEFGTLLVSNPKDLLDQDDRIFIAEFRNHPLLEEPGRIWVKEVRLVREATNLDLKRFGIFRTLIPK